MLQRTTGLVPRLSALGALGAAAQSCTDFDAERAISAAGWSVSHQLLLIVIFTTAFGTRIDRWLGRA
jgi:hypothetical protein